MKKILFLLICPVFACKSFNASTTLVGNYEYKHGYVSINLELQADSTFNFKTIFGRQRQCQGKWNILGEDSIRILCDDEPWPAVITDNYLDPREHHFKIITEKKIKYEKWVLRRINKSKVSGSD